MKMMTKTLSKTWKRTRTSKAIPLYRYQQEAASLLHKRGGLAGLFMGMGTGKTRVALSYLIDADARVVLVVCPLSAVGVWRREIHKLDIGWRTVSLSSGSVRARASVLHRVAGGNRPTAILINYAAFWRKPLRSLILKLKPDSIVFDEAHRLKNRATKQSRFAHILADKSWTVRRLALTGSPVDEGIEDLFSLYRFIDSSVFGKSWNDFDRRYLIRGGFGGHQIRGYRRLAIIKNKLAATSFRISKEEALDLPERITTNIPVLLTGKSLSAYKKMQKDSLVKLDEPDEFGKPRHGAAFASIVLTQLIRLQQITSGFLPIEYDNGDSEILELGDDKLKITIDLVSDAIANGERVVIFCQFRHDLRKLRIALPRAGVIAGGVSASSRDMAIRRLSKGELDILLVQTRAGSESVDLTAASVAIFYNLGHSLLEYRQARDRLHRHGQTKRVLEYILIANGTVDAKILKALKKKQNVSKQIMAPEYARSLFQ